MFFARRAFTSTTYLSLFIDRGRERKNVEISMKELARRTHTYVVAVFGEGRKFPFFLSHS
jgi:hypothetical protein